MIKRRSHRRSIITAVAVVGMILTCGLYLGYRLQLRPVAATGPAKEFAVAAGDNAPRIAQHLLDAGLIRDRTAFVTYVNFHGLRPRLKVGRYLLAPTQSADQIADTLASGHTLTKRLTVPEGYRLTQIETAAAAVGISQADFKAALSAPHAQSFLTGKPASVDLEGYLFPDSYQIDSTTTATTLVNDMLDTFGKRVGPEYVQTFTAEGLTLHQGLTLASMVEREVNIPADRPIVAQIFLKRLRLGQTLGSDVTAHYAAELLGVPFSVDIDSHYNTRRYPGLPPGPICSPGLSALDAAAHPAATDYLFFLSGKDGKTYFAKTLAEHNQNIAKHL
ncbi:MAG TPA: endolytic transglycosylase MltG [Candidatus Saccharimonadia bacterium]|nr:endolytic transglycosylase MltG [Candidatus Saccharimonadia bacterium]